MTRVNRNVPSSRASKAVRLDKYLANNSTLSRKEVRIAVKTGRVLVDGEPASSFSQHIEDASEVLLDGAPVEIQGPGYFMMNKAAGWICSHSSDLYPSVYACFDRPAESLHVAGRLDVDTTGLILVTGDGQWSHRITSPARHCEKIYRVGLAEFITPRMTERLEKGVFLSPEKVRTRPARVEVIRPDEIRLTITEGRYHQVKRMLEAVENKVEWLHREQVGELKLDPDLAPGEWRALQNNEIALF